MNTYPCCCGCDILVTQPNCYASNHGPEGARAAPRAKTDNWDEDTEEFPSPIPVIIDEDEFEALAKIFGVGP